MKCLTLYQYWASMIMWGEKEYETRSWSTRYRGTLVIHAGKNRSEVEAVRNANSKMTPGEWSGNLLNQVLDRHGIKSTDDFPYGAALGTVQLIACWPMSSSLISSISDQERSLGLWRPERYAWHFINPRPFAHPIPMLGMLGLFECNIDGAV